MANPGPRRLATKARNRLAWINKRLRPDMAVTGRRGQLALMLEWLLAEAHDATPDEQAHVLDQASRLALHLNDARRTGMTVAK